jgi:hypothetical protein
MRWGTGSELGLSADGLMFGDAGNDRELRVGALALLFGSLNLALGLRSGAGGIQPSFGAGLGLEKFKLSYAVMPGSILGNTQLVSLEIKL